MLWILDLGNSNSNYSRQTRDQVLCVLSFNSSLPAKITAISQTTFVDAFLLITKCLLNPISLTFGHKDLIIIVSVGSGNGLAPNRCQAITRTDADPIHWRTNAALGGDELMQFHHTVNVDMLVDNNINCSTPLDLVKPHMPGVN